MPPANLSPQIARMREVNTTHGHARRGERSRTYVSWFSMVQRCEDPRNKFYADYGGRGIAVCARWRRSFAAFLRDMGARPADKTLDRKDNDGDYRPGNCRWATRHEQRVNQRNRRAA